MKNNLILFITFLLYSCWSFASTDTVKNTYGKASLVNGATLVQANNAPSVTGSRFAALPITSSSTFTLESSVGLIQFSIAGTAPDAKPVITLEVTSKTYDGTSIITTVDNVTLDLDVKASGSKSKAFWIKKDAHQMSVKVITLTGVPNSGWDNLTLTTAVITSAYDD